MTAARVLQIAESAGWAGGEAYLLKLAGALDRTRFRLEVVVPGPGPLVDRLRALGVDTHELALPILLEYGMKAVVFVIADPKIRMNGNSPCAFQSK